MRTLMSIALLLVGIITQAQKIETVHVKDIDCKYDTVAILRNKVVQQLKNESNRLSIDYADGTHQVLSVSVFTTECTCNDCSESFDFAITIDSLEQDELHYLKKEEVVWLYDNAWIEEKEIKNYLGYIKYLGEHKYELKISEMLNATIIRSIHLNFTAESKN